MASAFSHAFVAAALGSAYARQHMPWHFWALSITCSILPDADVIGFALGLPYDSPWGHRGLSHSLCFAFALSLCVGSLAIRKHTAFSWPWWSYSRTLKVRGGIIPQADRYLVGFCSSQRIFPPQIIQVLLTARLL